MPVDVPWDAGDLWTDVQPLFEWPPTDEDRVNNLGVAWADAGAAFRYAGAPREDHLDEGWSDAAGTDYQAKITALREATLATGDGMTHVGWLATEFGNDLRYTKESIARLIRENARLYGDLRNFFGWPDGEARARLVERLAALINVFLGQMADRIAARGAGEEEIRRPGFPAGPLDDKRWEELAQATYPGDTGRPREGGGKVGDSLRTVDDVLANPQLLAGKSPAEVEAIIGNTPGWRIETLGKGSHAGQGWVLRQYNERGNPTGPQIRWHPGGGHHGPDPYWRVTGPGGDLGGIIR